MASRPMSSSSQTAALVIDGGTLDLAGLEAVARDGREVALSDAAREAVRASRRVVDAAVARGDVVYGVTTGFGNFADVHIPTEQAARAAGQPGALARRGRRRPARAGRDARADAAARERAREGLLGRPPRDAGALLAMLNARVHPVVPSQGSVGASGDLAPLAHLALALIGEGECASTGAALPAAEALRAAGLAPLVLEAKEGLALINGTQLMTAVAGARARRRRAPRSRPPT